MTNHMSCINFSDRPTYLETSQLSHWRMSKLVQNFALYCMAVYFIERNVALRASFSCSTLTVPCLSFGLKPEEGKDSFISVIEYSKAPGAELSL